jgi:predicted GIY-YIG superfamily endonuclease
VTAWFVYMVRCGDGTLYTGIATDVDPRLAVHRAGKGAKYLRGRGPIELVYRRRAGSLADALREERRIKGLGRRAKERLVSDTARCRPVPDGQNGRSMS